MNFEFKGVTISEPHMMDVDKMSGHPKLFHLDRPINPNYIHDCDAFGYEYPAVNKKGIIFSHYNDWVARKTSGHKQMLVVLVDGIEDYEIPFLFHKNALSKTDYPGLGFFISEWFEYLTKHPVGIEMCKTIPGRDINYKIGDRLQISGSMVEKIKDIIRADKTLLLAIGKHDKEGKTFSDVLKEAKEKLKLREEQNNKTKSGAAGTKTPTKNHNGSPNPQPAKKGKVYNPTEGLDPDEISFSIIVSQSDSGRIRKCTVELNGEKLDGKLLEPKHDDELHAYTFRFVTNDKRVIDIRVPDYKPIQMKDSDPASNSGKASASNFPKTYDVQL